jgi:hypothetical protein
MKYGGVRTGLESWQLNLGSYFSFDIGAVKPLF